MWVRVRVRLRVRVSPPPLHASHTPGIPSQGDNLAPQEVIDLTPVKGRHSKRIAKEVTLHHDQLNISCVKKS